MLRRYSQVLIGCLVVADLAVTAVAGLAAYEVRYSPWGQALVPVPGDVPPRAAYLVLLMIAVPLAGLAYHLAGLYQARRSSSFTRELGAILRAASGMVVALITANFFLKGFDYSRAVIVIFFAFAVIGLAATRGLAREVLRVMRRRGWNLRYVLIVGAGRLGQLVAERILANPWTGLRLVGFLDPRPDRAHRVYGGIPVLGDLSRLPETLTAHTIDQVFVALPFEAHGHLPATLDVLTDHHVDVRLVPDTLGFQTLNLGVDDLAGLPIVNLRDTPLYGWNRVAKRGLDIVASALGLVLIAPLLVAIAVAIRVGSPGPVLYRQERMGLDGRLFQMLKFRTMRVDAEAATGAVWAVADDPRRTAIGSFLRKTSLDELPQLWNVLKGEMSLVGPRPERPVFIAEFRRTIPRYMLRHKVKAGMTGWAQVNGWRGNTSLRKRIQYDLDYIERFSLAFDLKILFMTVFRGFVSTNAY